MPVANFTLSDNLENQIEQTIRQKGFHSKAEFFRASAIHYLQYLASPTQDQIFDYLTTRLATVAHQKLGSKKFPSLRSQLKKV